MFISGTPLTTSVLHWRNTIRFLLEHFRICQTREEHILTTHSDPAPKAGRRVWEPLSVQEELPESSDSY